MCQFQFAPPLSGACVLFVVSMTLGNTAYAGLPKSGPALRVGTGHPAQAHLPPKYESPPKVDTPPMVSNDKEMITQRVIDGLKAGKPQVLVILFVDTDIQSEAAADRAQRHLSVDDAKIDKMKRRRFKALKASVLAGIPESKLHVIEESQNDASMMVQVSDYKTLMLLLDNPRVRFIGSMDFRVQMNVGAH
jgi:5S rRNA maturation endonuclease (ribonuclease M5)